MVPVAAAIPGLVGSHSFSSHRERLQQRPCAGVVVSTDAAFLVSALVLNGPHIPGRLRAFLLALAVVDDIGALNIIALVQPKTSPAAARHRLRRARRRMLSA
jgi:Na+/H+ antiporter NhaA